MNAGSCHLQKCLDTIQEENETEIFYILFNTLKLSPSLLSKKGHLEEKQAVIFLLILFKVSSFLMCT